MAVNKAGDSFRVTTTEMHTGGEPLRIIETGIPTLTGKTILDKRREMKEKYDDIRRLLMHEPRGHFDMYGAVLVTPDLPEADVAVLFLHNEGYSTMCGHAVIALGRYLVDKKVIPIEKIQEPEVEVNIQCPCGLVKAYVEYKNGQTGSVRFHSVPSFAFALDVSVIVPGFGEVKVDIGYGGAFYALLPGHQVGIDVKTSKTADIINAASKVSEAVRSSVQLSHPEAEDLCFLYGTILTDGKDVDSTCEQTANVCVFADREVDRSPTGSGVSARVAVQHARGTILQGTTRTFISGVNGSKFKGEVFKTTKCGRPGEDQRDAVVVQVSGRANYIGSSCFILEETDQFQTGFLPK